MSYISFLKLKILRHYDTLVKHEYILSFFFLSSFISINRMVCIRKRKSNRFLLQAERIFSKNRNSKSVES